MRDTCRQVASLRATGAVALQLLARARASSQRRSSSAPGQRQLIRSNGEWRAAANGGEW